MQANLAFKFLMKLFLNADCRTVEVIFISVFQNESGPKVSEFLIRKHKSYLSYSLRLIKLLQNENSDQNVVIKYPFQK